jgi:uncharacterized protein
MRHILFHAGCPDGFGSALAAWKRFGIRDTMYHPVMYGDPTPEDVQEGDEVFMVDVTFGLAQTEQLAQKTTLQIIDHHKSAMAELGHLPYAMFDMDHSGSVLAWNWFHGTDAPVLLRHVEDRDLWNWKMDGSKQVCSGLDMKPMVFESWNEYLYDVSELIVAGKVVDEYKTTVCERIMAQIQWRELQGYRVPVLNTPVHMSELGHLMCREYPHAAFSASYYDDKDGLRRWSLRSIGDFDVSEIAKVYGGGGHRNAAGFRDKP